MEGYNTSLAVYARLEWQDEELSQTFHFLEQQTPRLVAGKTCLSQVIEEACLLNIGSRVGFQGTQVALKSLIGDRGCDEAIAKSEKHGDREHQKRWLDTYKKIRTAIGLELDDSLLEEFTCLAAGMANKLAEDAYWEQVAPDSGTPIPIGYFSHKLASILQKYLLGAVPGVNLHDNWIESKH